MEKTGAGEPKKPDKVGCLPFLLGAVLGFVLALLWSRSQVHTMGADYVIRGEPRIMLVFTHAMLGAVFGGFVVTLIAKLRRKLKKADPPRQDKNDESQ